ncbi:MAG TPA: hypothetical protein VGL65_07225 [Gemmatimonadales bacterium]
MQVTTSRVTSAVAAVILLAGCGDARLDKLALGVSKDSATALIGATPHRTLSYLTAGKTWEIELYARSDAGATDSIAWRKMSPVVFINGKSVGWGWSWWNRTAKAQSIVMP